MLFRSLLNVLDDVFLLDFPLKPTQSALQRFPVLDYDFRQNLTPPLLTKNLRKEYSLAARALVCQGIEQPVHLRVRACGQSGSVVIAGVDDSQNRQHGGAYLPLGLPVARRTEVQKGAA